MVGLGFPILTLYFCVLKKGGVLNPYFPNHTFLGLNFVSVSFTQKKFAFAFEDEQHLNYIKVWID